MNHWDPLFEHAKLAPSEFTVKRERDAASRTVLI